MRPLIKVLHIIKLLIISFVSLFINNYSYAQDFDYYFEKIDTYDGLPTSQIYSVHEDVNGYIWFTTDRGMVRYDSYEYKTFTTSDGLSDMVNFSFYVSNENNFWVNGLNGTFSFWNGERFIPFKFNFKIKGLLKNKSNWFNILQLKNNKLFFYNLDVFSTNKFLPKTKDLYSIDINTGEIERHSFFDFLDHESKNDADLKKLILANKYKFKVNEYLKNKHITLRQCLLLESAKSDDITITHFPENVTSYLTDSELNLWVTTKKRTYFFEKGELNKPPIVLLKNVSVSSIYESSRNNYWISTTDNGVYFLPSVHVKKIKIKDAPEGETYDKLKVHNDNLIALSEKDRLYIISKNKETFSIPYNNLSGRMNINAYSDSNFKYDTSNLADYSFNVSKINDNLYFVFSSSGIALRKNIEKYEEPSFGARTLDIKKIKNRHYASTTNGLYELSVDDESNFKSNKIFPKDDLHDNRINDFCEAENGIWLVSLSNGLYFLSQKNISKIRHDKLQNLTMHCIYLDDKSNLWLGTNKGLLKIAYTNTGNLPKIDRIETYTTTDGLISNYINDITTWNNHICIATDNGIALFKPDKISINQSIPKLKIENLYLNNKSITNKINPSFNHNENNISISYTGISFNRPLNLNAYRYKLNEGQWNYTNSRKVDYNKLNYGNYRFYVQSRNSNDLWSETASIAFEIKPHFTQRIWFIILSISFIIGTIILYMHKRTERLKKRTILENRYRKAELSTLRNQMNPHFVSNSLTAIQGLIFKGSKIEASDYISRFSLLMRKSLEYSKLENIGLDEEISFMNDYLELEKKRFNKKFEYNIAVNGVSHLESVSIPPLLVQPLAENSIKHAFKKSKKKGILSISYDIEGNMIIIRVSDNGIGMSKEKMTVSKHNSMGLAIVKERVALLKETSKNNNVSISINSNNGKGTSIKIIIPLIKKND